VGGVGVEGWGELVLRGGDAVLQPIVLAIGDAKQHANKHSTSTHTSQQRSAATPNHSTHSTQAQRAPAGSYRTAAPHSGGPAPP